MNRANPAKIPKRAAPVGHAERWGALLVGLLILVVLVVVFPSARNAFDLPKLVAAQVLGLASLLVLAFELFPLDRIAPWRQPVVQAVAPLVAVAALGWFFSPHRVLVDRGLAALATGAACLIGWSAGIRSRKLYRLLGLLTLPAAVLALIALLQALRLFEPFALSVTSGNRLAVTSLAGNVGTLGACLVLPLLVAQARAMRSRRWSRGWWWYLAVIALSLAGLAATQTLTPLLAVGAGSALLWYLRLPRRRWLAFAGASVLAAALFAAGVAPIRGRVVEKWHALRGGHVNVLLTGRLDGWRAAAWMMEEHPFVGVGEGAFVAEFVPAKLALLKEGVRFNVAQATPVFSHAHNELLEVGAELGLLGLAALAWALFVLARTASRLAEGATPERALKWGGLLALGLLSLADFPFRLAIVGYPALLFLAWVFRRSAEVVEE